MIPRGSIPDCCPSQGETGSQLGKRLIGRQPNESELKRTHARLLATEYRPFLAST
jgi:hypothetical protein